MSMVSAWQNKLAERGQCQNTRVSWTRRCSAVLLVASGLVACGDSADTTATSGMEPPVMAAPSGSTAGAAAGPARQGAAGAATSTAASGGTTRPAMNTTPSAQGGSPAAAAADSGTAALPSTSTTGMTAAGGASAAAGAPASTTGTSDAAPPYHDPGTGPWEMGTPEDCKIDTSMIGGVQNLAVFRYGKLCHVAGGNTSGQNWSATKTLGGVLAGRAAYLVKDAPRSGAGTGPILHEDKATDWLGTVSYNQEALLSHVMAMVAHNANLSYGAKSFSYDTVGTVQISSIVSVSMVALKQASGAPTQDTEFMNKEVFMKLGMNDSTWPGSTIGYGWTGTLEDMGRVGVMLAHDGWYGGERFMEASWVYRMSHPSHEDANTAYGQLAWLNNRGGGTSFGAAIDQCAPAAFWPKYPHVGSEAPDCGAQGGGSCTQENDIGVFSAQGLGGQFIVVHPGLDLVITAHNASAPASLWADVRPALVAMDPMFKGDETAFCEAYGSGSYAPDLLAPRVAPTM